MADERSIICNPHEVLGLLSGQIKQLRRVVKPQPKTDDPTARWSFCVSSTERKHVGTFALSVVSPNGRKFTDRGSELELFRPRCPYGLSGDRLWVRETWAGDDCCGFVYRADHPGADLSRGDLDDGDQSIRSWRPSTCMPRAVSRLTLEVTGVRVARLHSLDEIDAKALGVETYREGCPTGSWGEYHVTPRTAFAELWDSTHGKRPGCSWDHNPWCWVIGVNPTEVAK